MRVDASVAQRIGDPSSSVFLHWPNLPVGRPALGLGTMAW
jgi:hypothetical protein